MSNVITTRRELLFLYDVKDANPNGDPLDENKPRIDEETRINIVTDVRLKRTIRDYLFNFKGYNGENSKDIFVRTTKSEEKGIKDGKQRAEDFGKKKEEKIENILNSCIDVRLFGAVIPLDKDSITYTGPVQFKMGRSLHCVELKHIKGTGAFASQAGKGQQTFREEYILPYSLICFYGIINENAAKHTNLTESDINELMEAIWEGTKNLISRSKMEHRPRLLIQIELNENGFFIGELDKYVELKSELPDEKIRDVSDFKIDLSKLNERLKKEEEKIKSIKIIKDERLNIENPLSEK